MTRKRQKMSFEDAMDLVPDDLPDGAFFAMAHEMAGLEYGAGFDEIDPTKPKKLKRKPITPQGKANG